MKKSRSNVDSIMATVILLGAAKQIEEEKVNEKEEQWTQVQKVGNQNQGPRKKGKDSKLPTSVSTIGKPSPASRAVNPSKISSNQFDVLRSDTL